MMVRVGLAMRENFDKYWNEDINVALAFAVVLDPSYKLLYLEFFFPKLYKKNDMYNLTMEEEKSMKKAWVKTRVDAVISKFRELSMQLREEDDSYNASMSQFMKLTKQKDVVEIKDEIDNSSFTVASESAFSLGSRVVDPFRATLTLKMVEGLEMNSNEHSSPSQGNNPKLAGEADYWWDFIKSSHDVASMTWDDFEEVFFAKYFRESARDVKIEEFVHLIQREIEQMRAKRFDRRLRPLIQEKQVGLRLRTYADVVESASLVEHQLNNSQVLRQARGQKRTRQQNNFPNKKPYMSSFSAPWRNPQASFEIDSPKCFNCGKFGHLNRNCPSGDSSQQTFNRPQQFGQRAPIDQSYT
ncbi:hypothetical protein QQ045_005003 [Rhodiola kirilowii]